MTAKIRFTKRSVEALETPEKGRVTYQDTEDRYLHLVLTRSARSWRYIRKVKGRTAYITLGRYPDMTPDQARQMSRKTSAGYVEGRDPQFEKRQARIVTTWDELFAWFIENHAKPHKKSWRTDLRVEKRYCRAWQSRDWRTLTPDVIGHWHKTIGTDHGKIAADRALGLIRAVFNRTMEKNVITGENPTRFVKAFYTNPSQYARKRFLTDEEVARLLIALDNYHDENMADVFRLCIYTGARHGEVRSMRWQDFDRGGEGRWLIPSAISKNKEPIPKVLIPEAVEILNRRWETRRSDEWVFPSHRHDAKTPYMAEPKFAWRKISEAANLKDVRIHDLRRTLGSAMARDGKSLTMIGIALGHKSLQATKIYARLSDAALRDAMSSAVGRMLAATGRKTLPASRESSPPDQ